MSVLRQLRWSVAWLLVTLVPAGAQELRGNLSLLGQVREGDQTRETEAPNDIYGDLTLGRLHHGSRFDTFFRLERDFGIEDGASDFYAGFVQVPGAIPGVEMTLGRQFVSEGPSGAFVADAGKVRIDPGWPVSFTLFGGAPRYFEPTFSTEILSDDETIWGGSIRTACILGTQLSAGYFGHERADHVLRQLMTGTAQRSFPELPGLPTLYGSIAYDPDHQNLDLGTAGVDFFLTQPRLRLNFEGTYYKPQDHEHDRPLPDSDLREDAIFELFSTGELAQWRAGITYPLGSSIWAVADYSFQHYDQQEGDQLENSHLASGGLVWLPGGDGLEVVRLDYYVIDSDTGNVNGGKAYYESRVYEQLVFRTKFDVSGYDSDTNREDVALSGFLGIGYVILPGLVCELNFEGNQNNRFDEDFRFGFLIDYNFRYRVPLPGHAGGRS
jgi:hypothetical protein